MDRLLLRIGFLYFCAFLTLVHALPTEDARNTIAPENEDTNYSDCLRKDSVSCVKYKLFSLVDKNLVRHDTIEVAEGVTVVRNPNVEKEGAPRKFDDQSSIEALVGEKIVGYLQSHSVKVELKGTDILNAVASTGRSLEDLKKTILDDDVAESRGKKKKAAKVLGPILLAVALKAAALIPLALGAIALIAGKALLIGKIALVLSAVIGLKKLLSQEKHVTYEVVAHPHHTSSHSASHSDSLGGSGYGDLGGSSGGYGGGGSSHGWGRSGDNVAQDLAYNAHST